MGIATAFAAAGVEYRSFALFLGSYLVVFALSGIGNGSIYWMIPAIFAALGRDEAAKKGLDTGPTAVQFKRQAAAAIGIAGAIGAFGGFLIQQIFRLTSADTATVVKDTTSQAVVQGVEDYANWPLPALSVFIGSYLVLAILTWWVYLRKQVFAHRVPSLAHAGV